MRTFSYSMPDFLTFPPDVVSQIACIHEYKGKQDLFLEADRDSLSVLLDAGRIGKTGTGPRTAYFKKEGALT